MSGVVDTVVNIFDVETNTVANISDPALKAEVTTVLSNPRLALNGRLIKILL